MSKTARLLGLAVLALAALAGSAKAQNGNSVKGKVVTESGKPVSAIIVTIENGLGTLVGQTTTNNEGDFFFGGLQGGSYFVLVSEVAYQPAREKIEFAVEPDGERPGENQYLHVTLTPKPGAPLPTTGTVFVQNVPPAARDAFDRGSKLSRENKSAEAVAAFREAVQAFPEYFDAHVALAGELVKANDMQGATKELDAANRVNPKSPRVYAMFGSVLSSQKKFAVAAAAFGEAARLAPTDSQYPLLRATVLIDQASITDTATPAGSKMRSDLLAAAAKDLDRSFELSGRSLAAVHMQRARLHEREGNRAAAADELEAYLKAVPNAPNAAAIRESVAKLRAAK